MNAKIQISTFGDRYNIAILVICVISLFLNAYGIWWGLPNEWAYPDQMVPLVIHSGKDMDLNPHYFINPSLMFYLIYIALIPYTIYLKFTGELNYILANPHLAELPEFTTNVFIIARSLSVFFGVMTVLMVYVLCKRIYNKEIGLISSSLLAFTMGFVNISHLAKVEILLTFLVVISMLSFIRIIDTGKIRYYMLGGLFAGLAASTKYTGLLLVLPMLIAHLLSQQIEFRNLTNIRFHRKIFIGVIFILFGFLIGTPYALLDFPKFSEDIYYVYNYQSSNRGFQDSEPGWISHGILNMMNLMGLPLYITFIIGFVYVILKRKRRYEWLILSWVVPYFFIISTWAFSPTRFTLPILPFLSIFGGRFFYDRIRSSSDPQKYLYLILLSIVLLYSFSYALISDLLLINDSRYIAREWMNNNIPTNSTIEIYDHLYGPKLPEHAIVYSPNTSGFNRYGANKEWDEFVEHLEERKPEYIVLTSQNYMRYLEDPNAYPSRTEFFLGLIEGKSNYDIIKVFGYPLDRNPFLSSGSHGLIQTAIIQSATLEPVPDFVNPTVIILKRRWSCP